MPQTVPFLNVYAEVLRPAVRHASRPRGISNKVGASRFSLLSLGAGINLGRLPDSERKALAHQDTVKASRRGSLCAGSCCVVHSNSVRAELQEGVISFGWRNDVAQYARGSDAQITKLTHCSCDQLSHVFDQPNADCGRFRMHDGGAPRER